ncbi:MAG TPA: BamA/TamA family outer membrane protein [Longimicrobiales bacterium]|nr:BamA/TamA family outer membrane protein [Longimicrobiales bacterium]
MNYLRLSVLALVVVATGCANRSRIAQLYPDVAEHAGAEVKSVRFVNGDPFGADSLSLMIETQPTHCDFLGFPICIFGMGRQRHFLDPNAVVRDAGRLTVFYRREGYVGTRVTPRVEPEAQDDEDVEVSFIIRRGDPVILETLTLEGVEGVLDSAATLRSLPLQPGELFDLDDFTLSADQVLRELQNRGHAYASVLRNYNADTLTDRATASITAVPGPVVRVDSIIVTGADELGRRTTIRQLGFRSGDVLQLPRLADAQRNLYSLELVQIASVGLAPDSLQRDADSTSATVLVAIAEADEYQARASVGFGSVECFRTDGDYVDRSFGGGGRRLRIDGSVSKIGLAGRTATGLDNNLCSGGTADPVAIDTIPSSLDYRLGVEITQPFFLTPRNQLSMNVYAERQSQPEFLREAVGSRVAVTHRLAPRTSLIGSVDVEKGRTIAEPVLFCSAFQVCTPEDVERVSGSRFRNTVGLNFLQDRTDHPLDPTRGHVLRTGVAWAAPFLSSDVTFVRWTGELAVHRVLKPGWVGAASLRLGNFFQSASLNPARPQDDFLPPEERFYAGGANSVRGYQRNRLGPGVYVANYSMVDSTGTLVPARRIIEDGDTTFEACADCVDFVPTGGTSVIVGNLEVRFPSPFLPRQLRLAAFIDGGSVGHGNLWDTGGWRFTPGVGLRITTPVGPARVDMAYNPYDPVHGALYVIDRPTGQIVQASSDFTVPPPNFWGRLRFHVAIGQAF